MLPTSTAVTVDLATKLPAKLDALALMATRDNPPDGSGLLGESDAAVIEALVSAAALPHKAGEVLSQIVPGAPAPRRLSVVGLGPVEKVTAQTLREAGAVLARHARRHKLVAVTLIVPDSLQESLPGQSIAQTAVESIATGFLLGSFQFKEFKGAASRESEKVGKTEKSAAPKPVKLTLVVEDPTGVKAALDRARIAADAQNLARTVASRPGNQINPPALAKLAQQIAGESGLTCRVLDERELAKLGMGGLLAVGGGSATPPRLIVLEHKPKAAKARSKQGGDRPVVLIGKSITFDTGGVSIKPAEKMQDMIFDKSGGMVVLGTMVALAQMNYPGHVVGVLTSAENHLSGTAYRPGDIIRQYNGVTVEITNTDAEGRLVLADAIGWAIDAYAPAAVVDLATLTGGCVVALGHTIAALFSNDEALAGELLAAGGRVGEAAWRMPVGDDQRAMLKSNHADIVNSAGRWASPLTGAAFLTFALPNTGKAEGPAKKVPWAHFDIAGVADTDKDLPLYVKGSTGWGVRTLLNWLESRIAGR